MLVAPSGCLCRAGVADQVTGSVILVPGNPYLGISHTAERIFMHSSRQLDSTGIVRCPIACIAVRRQRRVPRTGKKVSYLCVASITLATRFAIEGGLDAETAYNISDLYIRRIDLCRSIEEMRAVHKDMFTFFTHKMADLKKASVFSKPVVQCLDYIHYHLHEKITVRILADYVGLFPSYLSTLFAKETGVSVSRYIMEQRLETAKNMLKFSEYSCPEIAAILAFSSQSHFIKVFKKRRGSRLKHIGTNTFVSVLWNPLPKYCNRFILPQCVILFF